MMIKDNKLLTMYAISAFAFYPSPSTPQPSVASIIVPGQEPALGRLPVVTVPAPIDSAEVRPQTKARTPTRLADAEDAASNVSGVDETPAGRAPTGKLTSFPTLFLAHLLGQGANAEGSGIVSGFENAYALWNAGELPAEEPEAEESSSPPSLAGLFTALLAP